MGLDLAACSNILKLDYLPDIREQLNNKVLMFTRLQRNTEDFVGQTGVLPLHVGRNSGIGARAEGGVLPDAGAQQYNRSQWDMSYQYARIEVTGPVIESTKSDMGAYVRAVDSEIKGAVQDLTQDLSRQTIIGDRTGVIADPADATAAGTTFVVDSVKWLEVGELIDFPQINVANTFLAGGVKKRITAINQTTKTITIDTATAAATDANTRICRNGNYGLEMFGLKAAVSASDPASIGGVAQTFGNIARGTSTIYWQANEVDGGGLDLSLDGMQSCIDTADQNSNGEMTLILTDYDQWRKYAKLLVPDRRFPTADGKPVKLNGGFSALMYDELEVVKDKYSPPQKMYFLDENTFQLFVLSDFDWMDKDGAVLSRCPNKDAYEATLRAYIQIACDAPRSNTLYTNLAA